MNSKKSSLSWARDRPYRLGSSLDRTWMAKESLKLRSDSLRVLKPLEFLSK